MTSLFTARRRAEEFAAAVDGDPRSAGAHRPEVAELVGVVTALRSHQDAAPRPEFVGDLRARLMTEAETVLSADNASLRLPVRAPGTRERRLVAAASAVVLLGGTAGMAAAAQNALPGEALYPIKRGIERAEAGLSLSPAGKGTDLLHQAADRLDEVQRLIAEDQAAPQVPDTLADFATQAGEGADLLLTSFEETRDPSTVLEVRSFAAEGITVLETLASELPPEAQDELTDAAHLLRDIDARAAALCSTCASGLPELEIPDLILARNEVDRVLDTVSSAGALDNSHPVVVQRGAGTEPRSRSGADGSGRNASGSGPAVQPPAAVPTGDSGSVPSPNLLDPKTWPTPTAGTNGQVSGGEVLTEGPKKIVKDVTDGVDKGLKDVNDGLGDLADGLDGGLNGPTADPTDGTSDGTDDGDAGSGDVTSGLSDGLSGVVETILPDTGVDQLLP
jgi:hypothetical protein